MIRVNFDLPTNENQGVRKARDRAYVATMGCDPYMSLGPCEQELSVEFLESLGSGPFCTWYNATAFIISIGTEPTVSWNRECKQTCRAHLCEISVRTRSSKSADHESI
jgi:hypothetical protein